MIDPASELRIEKAEATGAIDSGSLLGEGTVAAILLPVCWKKIIVDRNEPVCTTRPGQLHEPMKSQRKSMQENAAFPCTSLIAGYLVYTLGAQYIKSLLIE